MSPVLIAIAFFEIIRLDKGGSQPLAVMTQSSVALNGNTLGNSTPALLVDPHQKVIEALVDVAPNSMRTAACESIPLIYHELLACDVTDPAQQAYVFATAQQESELGKTMVEIGGPSYFTNRYENRRDLRNVRPGDGALFCGRGFAQTTGRHNYQHWTDQTGIDYVGHPEYMAELDKAAKVLVRGMKLGSWTGKKLSDYLGNGKLDFVGARRIIIQNPG